jgi:hypothetical protein
MRRLASLLSLCALLAAQTPFTPCPAGVVMDRDAAAPAAAAPAVAGAAAQHHHAPAAAAAEAGAADLTVPAAPEHGGSCRMLARCEWVAVPTQPVGAEPLRGVAFVGTTGPGSAPSTVEPFSSTPPPRPAS